MTRTVRTIIKIDEDKCNGCGDCIVDCPEGALQLVDGKARLVKESYCDGLGVCIGKCPVGAITIEEREADAFDEEAVNKHMAGIGMAEHGHHQHAGACPGAAMRQMAPASFEAPVGPTPSQLSHWPVQLALVPPGAPFLQDADVLLVADCVPFALADFHQRFLDGGRPVLVACPKLDDTGPYVEKLKLMSETSSMHSLTMVHMEVPCCSGLCHVVRTAMQAGGRALPVTEVTVGIDGKVIAERQW